MKNELIDNVKNNSICSNKEKFTVRKKTIKKSLFMLSMAVIITLTATACVGQKSNSVNQNTNSTNSISISETSDQIPDVDLDFDLYIASINKRVDQYLYINNMDYTNREYTVEEYKSMKYLSEDDLIGYYNILGVKESEKVVQALGYKDWNDYLISNGYIKDGQPSFDEWEYQLHVAYHAMEMGGKTR